MDDSAGKITGTVEAVTFHNDETGFTVCKVRPADRNGAFEPFTVVGNCAAIWVGEELTAEGRWKEHKQFGERFEAEKILCVAPTSAEGIRRFLASGMIKGIGPVNAGRIVAKFGAETLHVIEHESGRLREVEGIGEARRKMIKESWKRQKGVRDVMIFLQSYGIGTGQAARLWRRYGSDTIAVVKRDPYRLCRDVWGIGFKTADSIALKLGLAQDAPERARAALLNFLHEQSDDGHCFCYEEELLLATQSALENAVSVEALAEQLAALLENGAIEKDENRIYLRILWNAERRVAAKLRTILSTSASFRGINAPAALEWAEKKMSLALAPSQRDALLTALTSKCAVITGGPGVGKTTIIRALTEVFGARKLRIALAAPTGRAAKRLGEATRREAKTIHRLLKYLPGQNKFEHDAANPLEADVVILDETSMIDIFLADDFLDALPASVTLILVGDIDQLPSVGPGNVLRDIISSGAIPCTRLEQIFRQDRSGLIVRNAHHINRGEELERESGAGSDFFFIETREPEKVQERIAELVATRIPNHFHIKSADIQVLTPMRKNSLGADSLNKVIQDALNPAGEGLQRGAAIFRARDRVMQIRNNYEKDVFNGDIGFVTSVDLAARELLVSFDGREIVYEKDELDELVHAYAATIHKSQGSEYPAVVIVAATQHFVMLQRNLLYTAVTRGRRLVVIVGSTYAVKLAIENNDVRARRTTLAERLKA